MHVACIFSRPWRSLHVRITTGYNCVEKHVQLRMFRSHHHACDTRVGGAAPNGEGEVIPACKCTLPQRGRECKHQQHTHCQNHESNYYTHILVGICQRTLYCTVLVAHCQNWSRESRRGGRDSAHSAHTHVCSHTHTHTHVHIQTQTHRHITKQPFSLLLTSRRGKIL